jgi:tetratricopeptide (TPR) repeat protein
MLRKKNRLIISVVVGLAAALIIASIIVTDSNNAALPPAELLRLGEKYLTELNYEQALVQFLTVIEIEPMNERAYIGAAEAYIGLGQEDKAIAVLERGIAVLPDSAGVIAMLDGLRMGNFDIEKEPEVENEPDVESELEPELTNLTGQEPFMMKDIDSWLFPHGITMYEIAGMYECNQDQIRNIENEFEDSYMGMWICEDPRIFISIHDESHGKIMSIKVDANTNSAYIKGPRGVSIGMSFQEVLNLFNCTNPEALRVAEMNDILAYREMLDNNNLSVYEEQNDFSRHSGNFFINGDANDGYGISYQIDIDDSYVTIFNSSFDDLGMLTEYEVFYGYEFERTERVARVAEIGSTFESTSRQTLTSSDYAKIYYQYVQDVLIPNGVIMEYHGEDLGDFVDADMIEEIDSNGMPELFVSATHGHAKYFYIPSEGRIHPYEFSNYEDDDYSQTLISWWLFFNNYNGKPCSFEYKETIHETSLAIRTYQDDKDIDMSIHYDTNTRTGHIIKLGEFDYETVFISLEEAQTMIEQLMHQERSFYFCLSGDPPAWGAVTSGERLKYYFD